MSWGGGDGVVAIVVITCYYKLLLVIELTLMTHLALCMDSVGMTPSPPPHPTRYHFRSEHHVGIGHLPRPVQRLVEESR